MNRVNKIQHLLITQLKEKGSVEIILPDGIKLSIGITQEDHRGNIIINEDDDYCWVMAEKTDKAILLDSFNLGLSFKDDPSTIIFEDTKMDDEGDMIRLLEVV